MQRAKIVRFFISAMLLLTLVNFSAFAMTPQLFDNQAQALRYRQLISILRCPKCENQNLANSNAPISEDIRNFVAQSIKKNQTDQEIQQALVDRFGEFILYEPRFEAQTWLLWLMPIFFLLVSFGLLFYTLKRKKYWDFKAQNKR